MHLRQHQQVLAPGQSQGRLSNHINKVRRTPMRKTTAVQQRYAHFARIQARMQMPTKRPSHRSLLPDTSLSEQIRTSQHHPRNLYPTTAEGRAPSSTGTAKTGPKQTSTTIVVLPQNENGADAQPPCKTTTTRTQTCYRSCPSPGIMGRSDGESSS